MLGKLLMRSAHSQPHKLGSVNSLKNIDLAHGLGFKISMLIGGNRLGRCFGGFENRAKDTDFSYLEYFEEKERNLGRQLPPMSFSTAKNHKSYSQNMEEDLDNGYHSYTIDDDKFDYKHQEDLKKRYQPQSNDSYGRGSRAPANKELSFTTPTGTVESSDLGKKSAENDEWVQPSTEVEKPFLNKLGGNLLNVVIFTNFMYDMHSNVFWILTGTTLAMTMSKNNAFSLLLLIWLAACGYVFWETVMDDPAEDKADVAYKMVFKKNRGDDNDGDDTSKGKK